MRTTRYAFWEASLETPWRIGRNVPWSAAWTGEDRFDVRASVAFPGCRDLVQIERPSIGEPRFRAMHVTRQRVGLADQLCHVCGRRTPRRDRYIFPYDSGSFVPVGDGLRYAGNVPPVHLACGKRAQGLCPHLSHSYAKPVPFPAEESGLMPLLDAPPGMEHVARALPPGLPIVYGALRVYGVAFSGQVRLAVANKSAISRSGG